MKNLYIKSVFALLLVLGTSNAAFCSVLTDTIKSIPFNEDWASSSFTTNSWTFPDGQGNWYMLTSSGLPAPCAKFMGIPPLTNYTGILESPWFDATQLTCDYIYLDFDLRLEAVQYTQTEKIRVEIEMGTNLDTMCTVNNSDMFILNCEAGIWQHFHLNLLSVVKSLFKVRFIAFGENSAHISGWSVDNIAVTSKCKPPRKFLIEESGQCGIGSCTAVLTWSPPVCGKNSANIQFIYDDGSAEEGYAYWPGQSGSYGNKFKLSPVYSGYLNSADLWFFYNPDHGSDMLTVDIYDSTRTLIGSSDPFAVPDSNWVTVDLNNIPFTGTFYAMVTWNNVAAVTNWLGYDNNGPNSYMFYDYRLAGNNWVTPANYSSCEDGIFLIRVTADVLSKKKQSEAPDSTVILGYNIFKADTSASSAFVKVNSAPVTDTSYTDILDCMASYYITTVFTTCESDPSAIFSAGCNTVGINISKFSGNLKIDPNPASEYISISSDFPINTIKITDLFGREQLNINHIDNKEIRINLSGLADGIYLLIAKTRSGQTVQKVIVQH